MIEQRVVINTQAVNMLRKSDGCLIRIIDALTSSAYCNIFASPTTEAPVSGERAALKISNMPDSMNNCHEFFIRPPWRNSVLIIMIPEYKSPAVIEPTPGTGSTKMGPINNGNGSRYKPNRGALKIRNILTAKEITTANEIAVIEGSTINRTAAAVQETHDKWNNTELLLIECNDI